MVSKNSELRLRKCNVLCGVMYENGIGTQKDENEGEFLKSRAIGMGFIE